MFDSKGFTVFGAAGLLALGFVTAFYYFGQNHDSLWMIIAVERLLNGGVMPTDVYELNPPSVFLPYVLPVLAAGEDVRLAYMFYVVEALALILLCWRLMVPTLNGWWPDGFARAGNLLVLAVLVFGGAYGFGQRDHIGFVLIMPFLLWLVQTVGQQRPVDGRVFLMAFLAALGVVLKVHLVLALIGVVAIEFALHRNLKLALQPVLWVFAAFGGALAALVLLAYPEWFEIAADAMAYYGGSDVSTFEMVTYSLRFILAILLWQFALKPKGEGAFAQAAPYLAVAVIGATLSAFLQFKGWPYHHIPLVMVAEAVLLIGLAHVWRAKRYVATFATLLLCGWMAQSQIVEYVRASPLMPQQQSPADMFAAAYGNAAGDQPDVLVLSTSVGAGIGLGVRNGFGYTSRSSGQWMAPGIIQAEMAGDTSAEVVAAKAKAVRDVVEDMERRPPEIVAIQLRSNYPHLPNGEGVPFPEFYLDDPAFRAAMSAFTLDREELGWLIYVRNR